MTPIKRNLLYIFRGSLLRLRISWTGSNSLTLSVGFHVDRKGEKNRIKWNGNRCVNNTTHGPDKTPAAVINRALENLEALIERAFYTFEMEDKIPTPDQLKAIVSSKPTNHDNDFWIAFSEFIREGAIKKNWAENTIRSVRNLYPILRAFNSNLTFEDINKETLDNFIQFQVKTKLSSKKRVKAKDKEKKNLKFPEQGYTNGAIIKNSRMLKWFLRWAAEKGYIDRNIERTFTPDLKVIPKPVIFLDWDELTRVENLDLSRNLLYDQVRDFFCFCCFTSLRFSDAYELKKIDVKETHIEVITKKTATSLIIELNSHSARILKKYSASKSEYALPHLTLAVINYNIRGIMKMAGIDQPIKITRMYGNRRVEKICPKYELISSHCARKTFICNALSMGIAPNIIMKWTGHSEYSAMKPYIDIVDKIKSDAMKAFDR